MTVRLLALTACLGLGFACDADKDGLSKKEEKELGLDPKNDDFDGDGLLDGDEIEAGSDPFEPDTDGDGVNDGTEVLTNFTDPLDPLDF